MPVDRSPAGFSVTAALQASRLGTSSLVFFAVAAAAPLTVVAGAVTTGYATVALVGLPAAYLVMTVILLIWTVGYTALSRQVVAAGALYAYIARGLGPTAGITAAAIALVAYPLMHLGLLAGLGAILTQGLAAAGIEVPWLAGTLTAWAVIAVLGTRRIDLTGRLLAVLLIAEVTVMIGYDAVLLTHPHGGHPHTGPLSPTQLLAPGGLLALVAVAASFTGIELPTVLGEEARNPHHMSCDSRSSSLSVDLA
jgi:amino acid transporter